MKFKKKKKKGFSVNESQEVLHTQCKLTGVQIVQHGEILAFLDDQGTTKVGIFAVRKKTNMNKINKINKQTNKQT